MKATLLVRNIEKIYTCQPNEPVIEHGFIACFHDRILAVGKGDGNEFLEPDLTRILEGRNCIATPAFIEPEYTFHFEIEYEYRKDLYQRFRNGMLNFASPDFLMARQDLQWHVYTRQKPQEYEIASLEHIPAPQDQDVLFTSMHNQYHLSSLQPVLFAAFQKGWNPEELLEIITYKTAQAMKLKDLGMLKKDMLADFLLMEGNCFQDYICTFGNNPICWIIKRGIPVWPHRIRC